MNCDKWGNSTTSRRKQRKASINVNAEVLTNGKGCYRFYYMRLSRSVLIYHGNTLDTVALLKEIHDVSASEFITFVEHYVEAL